MAKIEWDAVGERLYETGVDRGVLYIPDETGVYDTGVAWNGLVTVNETPTGAEESPQYADNIKYVSLYSAESLVPRSSVHLRMSLPCLTASSPRQRVALGSSPGGRSDFLPDPNRNDLEETASVQDSPCLWLQGHPVGEVLQHGERLARGYHLQLGGHHASCGCYWGRPTSLVVIDSTRLQRLKSLRTFSRHYGG